VRLTRREAQDVTHRRLLAAGRTVLLRRGFLAATVEEVAAEAGYTRGAVYKHFGGKEGLWHALVDEQCETLLGVLRHAVRQAGTRDDLLAVLNPGQAVADPDTARWAVVSAEAMAALTARPQHAARFAAVQRRLDDELVALLADCCRRLGLRPSMPLPHLVVAWGALGGGLALRHALGEPTDVAAVAAGALAAFLPPAAP
jgi:AcrR family transcriptional regulator